MKCSAIGFNEADLRILETLLSMFRSKLHADWIIDPAWDADCALLLCDIDSGEGMEAWRRRAPDGVLRAAVTASTGTPGDMVLRRPLRGHGPSGLVHVLNLASGHGAALPPAPHTPPPPPVARPAAPMPEPIAAPAAAEAVAVAEVLVAPSPAAASATSILPLQLSPRQPDKPLPRATDAVREEDEILDVMQRMRYRSRGIPLSELGLLAALRRAIAMGQPAVLNLPGLPGLCLMPQERAYYATASAAEISKALTPEPTLVRVVPYGDPAEAREATGSIDANPRSIDQLTWLACVRCPEKDTTRHESSVYRLRRWPDLGQVPHEPHHLRWCGVLSRQPSTLRALAAATGSSPQDVAAFLDACAELEILESRPATPADLESITVPEASQQTKQVRERISLLRSILNKLGIRRS